MGILELLTIIFVVCKLFGVISWSWWIVLLPEIIAVTFYIVWYVVFVLILGKTFKSIFDVFKKDDFFNR